MIFIKKFFLILLICIMVIFGVFVFLFKTNVGINMVVSGIINCIPGLTIKSVTGNWENINILNLTYNMPTGIISIDNLYTSINLKRILFKEIKFENLFLRNVFIKIDNSNLINGNIRNHQSIKMNYFYPKIRSIICKDVVISNINIVLDNIEFQFQKLNTSIVFQDNLLKIFSTYINGGSIFNKFFIDFIQKKCFMQNQLNFKNQIKTIIDTLFKVIPKFEYRIPVNFNLIDIRGKNIYFYNYKKSNGYLINDFYMQFFYNTNKINMKLKIHFPYGYMTSVGNIVLHGYYPINFTVNYKKDNNIKNYDSLKLNEDSNNINLVIQGDLIDKLCIRLDLLDMMSTIHILFKIHLKSYAIPIDLLVIGKKIPIPLLEKKTCFLENIQLRIIGDLSDNYHIYFQSELIHENNLKLYLSLYAQGNFYNCTIFQLQSNFLNKPYNTNINMNWDQLIYWNNVSMFNDVDMFKIYYPLVPRNLLNRIVKQKYLFNPIWEFKTSQFQFNRFFYNMLTVCNNVINIDSDSMLKISNFFIKIGSSIIEINGDVKNNIFDINVKFKKISCSDFSSRLSGNLYGYCKLYGPITSLILSFKLNVFSIIYKDKLINIGNMLIDSSLCFNKSDKSYFFLKIDEIQYKKFLLNQLCIKGMGNIDKHYLDLKINSCDLSGNIHILGNLNCASKIWNGRIFKTNIITSIGVWKLMQDIILVYNYHSNSVILKSHFWKNACCKFSISREFQKNILKKINTICADLDIFAVRIKPIDHLNIDNLCILFTDFYWVIGKEILPQGIVFITGSQLFLEYIDKEKIVFPIVNNKMTIELKLTQIGLFGIWKIQGNNNNKNFINFCITELYDIPKIVGTICLSDLSMLPIFESLLDPKIVNKDLLNVDINFTGYVYNPNIYGVVKYVYNDRIKLNKLFLIKKSLLQINFFGNYAKISGIMETDYGEELYIYGSIKNFYTLSNINVLLNLRGNSISIYVAPHIYATISPNIVCTITTDKINIQGNIDVLSAQIKIQKFSKNIIRSTVEEVILDQNLNPISKISEDYSFLSISNITICFGNDVNFHGFGLHTKLKGKLDVSYYNNDLIVIGHINIFSGYFEVYGQNLVIKKGQLLFSGSMNQVYFDIEAMRNSMIASNIKDCITAGIRIRGMIDQLKLDFFSSSTLLSQQEIMFYMFNGYNVIPQDINDTNMITSLLIGAGMKRYENIINKIGYILGIKDLKINAQDFGSPSLIALSGYIAPGLQIKYGINSFDLLETMTIRYCVYPHLCLEATTGGRYFGLDFLYKLYL